jgi:hypothetical protein|uniref:Uncharacterized protein n=1 Tax=Myoviridae sp. ctkfK18 TaxID=2825165 RepID=A0A8S5VGR1_9CAUD|nr:MAG TPA: hypothetical protein [Myoviridae sp. ctkfK18]
MVGNMLFLNVICLVSAVLVYFVIGGTYDSDKPKTFKNFWIWYIIMYTCIICICFSWVMANNGILLLRGD